MVAALIGGEEKRKGGAANGTGLSCAGSVQFQRQQQIKKINTKLPPPPPRMKKRRGSTSGTRALRRVSQLADMLAAGRRGRARCSPQAAICEGARRRAGVSSMMERHTS